MDSTNNSMSKSGAASGPSGIPKMYLYAGAAVIVIIAAIAILMILKSPSPTPVATTQLTTIYQSGAVTPLDKAVAQSTHNFTSVSSFVAAKLNQTQQFNVNYSGSLLISVSGQGTQLSIPFALNYAKYGNDSRTSLSATQVPILGTVNESIFQIGKKEYTCTIQSTVIAASTNGTNTNKTVTCQSSSNLTSSSVPLSINNYTNNSAITIRNTGGSTYNGASCYSLNGVIAVPILPGSSPTSTSPATPPTDLNGTFTACFSEQYYIPLYINMTGAITTPQETVNIGFGLHAISIGNSVSKAYVDTLPAPVTT